MQDQVEVVVAAGIQVKYIYGDVVSDEGQGVIVKDEYVGKSPLNGGPTGRRKNERGGLRRRINRRRCLRMGSDGPGNKLQASQ